MTRDALPLLESEITGKVLGAFHHVYNRLGVGFLESVYRRALQLELRKLGLEVEAEVAIDVHYDGVQIGHFRADLVVERREPAPANAPLPLLDSYKRNLRNAPRVDDGNADVPKRGGAPLFPAVSGPFRKFPRSTLSIADDRQRESGRTRRAAALLVAAFTLSGTSAAQPTQRHRNAPT